MLSLVILSSFVLVCLGKTESSLQGIVDSKALAIQQLQHTLGVDITQIQVVRRHGQLSQATNGWAYVRLHSFGDCSGDDFMSLGLATGVCLADQPDVNGQVTTSYVYSCTDSK
ncbi:hypothetical protein EON65_46595 [archaeon]|nr:MAG: hypothetical protein EON65_46595 [archaeon]